MFQHQITHQIAPAVAIAAVAVGTGDTQNGNTIDTQDAESIAFAVQFGAITAGAVTTLKVQAGSASDGSDMADVAGASVSVPVSASDKVVWAPEIHRPTKRYLRVCVTRATANAVIAGGVALLGRQGVEPPAATSTQGGTTPPPVLVSVP